MRRLALLTVATALAAQDPVDLHGWLNRGVHEFTEARYQEAVAAFERAAAIDPSNVTAQLYLGTAYMQQYIPGAESPENLRVAEVAQAHFLRVLDLEPSNKVAVASLAMLFLNRKKWDDAQQWYEKLTAADPRNADAYYSMGFIAWSRWYPAYSKARAGLGMQPAEPGPIQDASVRADLMARYGPVIESGLRALKKALEINPQYGDAMAYMNLFIRERADLRDTAEEWKRDVAIADEWIQKALATKKAKAEQRPQRRITISGDALRPQLIHDVPPVYPELAKQRRIQGVVRVGIVIDIRGGVSNVTLISGHPLLVQAALDAVKQWEYQPTFVNGQAVEVSTEVTINFAM